MYCRHKTLNPLLHEVEVSFMDGPLQKEYPTQVNHVNEKVFSTTTKNVEISIGCVDQESILCNKFGLENTKLVLTFLTICYFKFFLKIIGINNLNKSCNFKEYKANSVFITTKCFYRLAFWKIPHVKIAIQRVQQTLC